MGPSTFGISLIKQQNTMKRLPIKSHFIAGLSILITSIMFMTSCTTNGQDKGSEPKNETVTTTIHEAAFMGDVNQIKAHIAAGSDLNAKDAYGSAPLSIAALFDKPEIARLLIEAGADVNVTSGDGSTPLHSAAFFGRQEIAEMLLKNGADTSIRNNYGSTALESISGPFDQVKPIYDQMSTNLGPLGLKLDYAKIEKLRPVIAEMIRNN
jgi:hypothetical protein